METCTTHKNGTDTDRGKIFDGIAELTVPSPAVLLFAGQTSSVELPFEYVALSYIYFRVLVAHVYREKMNVVGKEGSCVPAAISLLISLLLQLSVVTLRLRQPEIV